MKFLHDKGMMHRDLKIENIMLNALLETKIVDFGYVKLSECVLNDYSYVDDSLNKRHWYFRLHVTRNGQ